MARLIKNSWARLIVLSAAAFQCCAAVLGFFQPKILFDFTTTALDTAVRPTPFLQLTNILVGLLIGLLEWPSKIVSGSYLHQSIPFRLVILLIAALPAILMYQSADAGLYYLTGLGVYAWAYFEDEVIPALPDMV